MFPKFTAEQMELCVYLTRVTAAGADFFLCRRNRVGGAAVAQDVPVSGAEPGVLRLVDHFGRTAGAHRFGIAALAYGALVGSFVGPFLINTIGAAKSRPALPMEF